MFWFSNIDWLWLKCRSDILYSMFIEPTITWVPSGFSGYIWLDTKIVLKAGRYEALQIFLITIRLYSCIPVCSRMGWAPVSNKMPGCHLANAWRSPSKHILQWRYCTAVMYQFNQSILYMTVYVVYFSCTIVDGGWSDWDDWQPCSVTCGIGTRIRQRTCNNPTPSNGGKDCDGLPSDEQPCQNSPCRGIHHETKVCLDRGRSLSQRRQEHWFRSRLYKYVPHVERYGKPWI